MNDVAVWVEPRTATLFLKSERFGERKPFVTGRGALGGEEAGAGTCYMFQR